MQQPSEASNSNAARLPSCISTEGQTLEPILPVGRCSVSCSRGWKTITPAAAVSRRPIGNRPGRMREHGNGIGPLVELATPNTRCLRQHADERAERTFGAASGTDLSGLFLDTTSYLVHLQRPTRRLNARNQAAKPLGTWSLPRPMKILRLTLLRGS